MTINEQIQNGATLIALTEDTTECVSIPAGFDVIIDLNGHRLSNDASEYTVSNFGRLTITDTVGGGSIYNDAPRKGCLVNHKNGIAAINAGEFVLNERDGTTSWYYIVNLGTEMTINDVTVNGISPNTSAVRNGFYTAQETQDDYIDEDVRMVINGGTIASEKIPVKNDNHGDLIINGGEFTGSSECVLNWNLGRIAGGTFNSPSGKYVIFSGSCAGEIGCAGQLDITGGTFIGGSGIYDLTETYDPEHEYPNSYSYIVGGKWEVADKENVASFIKPGYEAEFDEQGNIIVVKEIEWTFPEGGAVGMGFVGMRRLVMHNDTVEYEEGGFDLPIRGFAPVCIIGAMAEGGLDAYYNTATKKIQFYRNGNELSGQRIKDVTLIIVG